MISFSILPKSEATNILPSLFRILHSNMNVIAPTSNSYDENDFSLKTSIELT